jgi:hypothetical protein
MTKKLIGRGNSAALILDKAFLDLLKVEKHTSGSDNRWSQHHRLSTDKRAGSRYLAAGVGAYQPEEWNCAGQAREVGGEASSPDNGRDTTHPAGPNP